MSQNPDNHGKCVTVWSAPTPSERTNAAFLAGTYAALFFKMGLDQLGRMISEMGMARTLHCGVHCIS
jgi:hypothetical protein